MTPHNEARPGDFAEAVLLPGDPDRAAWIAETFFDAPRLVNGVRGELGFSGSYRGMPVSIQSTGIGRPSFSIYAHELVTVYGARRLVRIGTCGGLDAAVEIRHLVVAGSGVMDFEFHKPDAWRRPDAALLEGALARAAADGVPHHLSPIVSSDVFYHGDPLGRFAEARARGVKACDMETSALYGLASRFGVRALSILTVVDNMVTAEETLLSERQALFGPMARLALDTLADDAAKGTDAVTARA